MFNGIRSFIFGTPGARPVSNHQHAQTIFDECFPPSADQLNRRRMRADPDYAEKYEEECRRREWYKARLWNNKPHQSCCAKCFQAGYVIAAFLAKREDLIEKYPELSLVYEELRKDGMLDTAFSQADGYSAETAVSRRMAR
jgi:hypothetical protein